MLNNSTTASNPPLVRVKQHHIDQGIECDTLSCALTLAGNEQTGEQCWTGLITMRIGDTRYHLPDEGMKFVRDFDDGQPVEPIDIQLIKEITDEN